MKKFVGKVNDETFDNEKDFALAAAKAAKKGGDLTITSFYSESEESNEGAPVAEEEEEKVSGLAENSYLLAPDTKPRECFGGFCDYALPEGLTEKLEEASNKDQIKARCEDEISFINSSLETSEDELKKLSESVSRIEDQIKVKRLDIRDYKARRRYYNTILDILSSEENKCPKCPENKGTAVESVFDFLDRIGFWRF